MFLFIIKLRYINILLLVKVYTIYKTMYQYNGFFNQQKSTITKFQMYLYR